MIFGSLLYLGSRGNLSLCPFEFKLVGSLNSEKRQSGPQKPSESFLPKKLPNPTCWTRYPQENHAKPAKLRHPTEPQKLFLIRSLLKTQKALPLALNHPLTPLIILCRCNLLNKSAHSNIRSNLLSQKKYQQLI